VDRTRFLCLDIDFLMRRVPIEPNLQVRYQDDEGKTRTLVIDQQYNTTLGPLQEDYLSRAIPIGFDCGINFDVYVASPVDLAISKLGRFAEHDRSDIRVQFIKTNLRDALKFFEAPTQP
jgi:hypothetical protein